VRDSIEAMKQVILLSIALAQGALARLAVSRARFEAATWGSNPIGKVVTLLKDMQQQLQTEGENDEAVFDKMKCWCETNDKEKTKSVEDLNAKITDLLTVIESTAAASARLTQEIANHETDLAKAMHSLETATSLRERQGSEFHGEEKDMIQSIKALESAIVILSKHHAAGSALVDEGTPASEVGRAMEVVRTEMQRHRALLQGSITPKQRRAVLALQLQQEPNTYMGGNEGALKEQYAPASGEIFGILRQMLDTFKLNLSDSQKIEMENQQTYQGMKAAKEDEIAAGQGSVEQKKTQLAEADETNAQSKQDLEDGRVMLTDDQAFLLSVKDTCAKSEQDFETRTKLRQEELTAVAQAISILSSDAAYDNFKKTYNFVQVHAARRQQRSAAASRRDVAALLRAVAAKTQNSELAELAVSVQIDAFTKVKQAINDMIGELVQEKQDEITHRDSCIAEGHDNQVMSEREERTKAELTSQKEGLEMTVKEKQATIDTLNSEIAELTVQIKRKGEDRELENHDFQMVVADHRETQTLLQKAIQVLKNAYAKPALLQTGQAPGGAAPPAAPQFETFKKQSSGGVIGLIEQIYNEAVTMEKDVLAEENTAQVDYENFVKDTNESIASKQTAIVNTTEDMEKAKQDLITTNDNIATSVTELEQLSNTAGALHMSCDFILKNFEVRQEARDQEVEALRQAIAILSGMQTETAE